jgi:hypothetical protein
MGFLPIIPALIAAYVATNQTAWRAYLNVYIPVLLLLPMYYRWVIPMLPDPTFEQATILPIAAVFLYRDGMRWKFSMMDFFMAAFAGCIGTSEYINAGYNEAQNLMFDMIATVVFPYMLTKGLLQTEARSIALAKRMVMMFLAVSIISVYEFRMGLSPWIFMRHFFPGQGLEWVTSFRYGFARIAGPYAHAILAGLVLTVGLMLQLWLTFSKKWEPQFKGLEWLPISKSTLITLGLLGGIVMTMVRGPWLGGVAGLTLASVGLAKHRLRALIVIVVTSLVVGIPAASAFWAYASVGRAHSKTASQETAAYRVELMDKYLDFVKQKPLLGYGRNTWPQIHTAPSIDNYYLLLSLMHGTVSMGLFVSIMLIMIFRLMRFEMSLPVRLPRGSSLGFILAGSFVLYAVTLATVYMGMQAIPVFAIMTGWSEAYLLTRKSDTYLINRRKVEIAYRPAFAFQRVVT